MEHKLDKEIMFSKNLLIPKENYVQEIYQIQELDL